MKHTVAERKCKKITDALRRRLFARRVFCTKKAPEGKIDKTDNRYSFTDRLGNIRTGKRFVWLSSHWISAAAEPAQMMQPIVRETGFYATITTFIFVRPFSLLLKNKSVLKKWSLAI
ncbi:hypothetical protein [Gibbsiella dentisursi]|uniref:hypothetical protein n=1 Tax=Gibbsiella dentisursi TaxID=796890 RepID=UPI0031F94149